MRKTVKTPMDSNRTIPLLTVLVLFTVIAAIAAFTLLLRAEQHGEQHVQRVAEQQVLGQKIAKYALEASAGRLASFELLRSDRDRFITLLDELKSGARDAGLPASPESMSEPLREVEDRWLTLRARVDEILANQNAILSIRKYVDVINDGIPKLQTVSEDIVRALVSSRAEAEQVFVAARQLMLAQRLRDNVSRVLAGGTQTAAAIDQLSADADRFGKVLNGMLTGDAELGVERVSNAGAEAKIKQATRQFRSMNDLITEIVDLSPDVLPALEATGEVTPASEALDKATSDLSAAFNSGQYGVALGPKVPGLHEAPGHAGGADGGPDGGHGREADRGLPGSHLGPGGRARYPGLGVELQPGGAVHDHPPVHGPRG